MEDAICDHPCREEITETPTRNNGNVTRLTVLPSDFQIEPPVLLPVGFPSNAHHECNPWFDVIDVFKNSPPTGVAASKHTSRCQGHMRALLHVQRDSDREESPFDGHICSLWHPARFRLPKRIARSSPRQLPAQQSPGGRDAIVSNPDQTNTLAVGDDWMCLILAGRRLWDSFI
jgi:hypothetical protein